MTAQARELHRVTGRIAREVMAYVRASRHTGFACRDLWRHVDARVIGGCAPASTDRVLRGLRRDGVLDYQADRRGHYVVLRVGAP